MASRDAAERRALVKAAVFMTGVLLFAGLVWALSAPLDLGTGLLSAARHLERSERALDRTALGKARQESLSAAAAAERAQDALERGGPGLALAENLPTVGPALGEVDHLVRAAALTAEAAAASVDVAAGALRGPDRIVVDDPEDPKGGARIRIDRIEEIGGVLGNARAAIDEAIGELEQVDLQKLPNRARNNVTDGIEKAQDTLELLGDAEAGFRILPGVLGGDGKRTYFFGLQNSAEQRGPGGALLQFKLMEIVDGRPELLDQKGGTIYKVDRRREQFDIPLPPDAWYNAAIPDARRFGNANWSPDWPLSAELTLRYAYASDPAFPQVDGVMALDPVVMKNLMGGVGSFETKRYDIEVAERHVLNLLLYKAYASWPVPKVRRERLGVIVDAFYKRMLDPREPTALAEGFGKSLAEKHMQIWLTDPREQAFIERMNWDGAIEEAKNSDFLYVVEQNVGGNKLSQYADPVHSYDVQFDGDDAAVSLRTEIENRVFLPQQAWAMGNTGDFIETVGYHRPMMNVYVPAKAELRLAEVDGTRLDTPAPAIWPSPDRPPEHREKGKKVWSATLEIPPGRTGALSLGYVVPDVVREERGRKVYRLTVQRQPRLRPELMTINIELPAGASAVDAPGFRRVGDTLTWERALRTDVELEVSWRS